MILYPYQLMATNLKETIMLNKSMMTKDGLNFDLFKLLLEMNDVNYVAIETPAVEHFYEKGGRVVCVTFSDAYFEFMDKADTCTLTKKKIKKGKK